MDVNTALDPRAMSAIGSAIAHLSAATSRLDDAGADMFRAYDRPDRTVALHRQLADYQAGIAEVLGAAGRQVDANDPHAALQSLLSAHAMTLAQITAIDIATDGQADWSTLASAAVPAASPATTPSPTPSTGLPPGLQSLLNRLGKIGAWLWSIIQTLLTPTGWSIEGGIGFPGLASAKLTVEFGK